PDRKDVRGSFPAVAPARSVFPAVFHWEHREWDRASADRDRVGVLEPADHRGHRVAANGYALSSQCFLCFSIADPVPIHLAPAYCLVERTPNPIAWKAIKRTIR